VLSRGDRLHSPWKELRIQLLLLRRLAERDVPDGEVGLAVGIMYPVLAIIEPRFNLYFGGQSVGLIQYFSENGLLIFGGQFLILVLITLFSTSLAMRKFLKV